MDTMVEVGMKVTSLMVKLVNYNDNDVFKAADLTEEATYMEYVDPSTCTKVILMGESNCDDRSNQIGKI